MKPLTYFEAGLYMYINFKLSFTFRLVTESLNFQILVHMLNNHNNKNLGIHFIYKSGTNGAKE